MYAIIDALHDKTDQQKYVYNWDFSYKIDYKDNSCAFTLSRAYMLYSLYGWFRGFVRYQPPPLRGSMVQTTEGCTVTASQQFNSWNIGALITDTFFTVVFIVYAQEAISNYHIFGHTMIWQAMILLLLVLAIWGRYVYTYRKSMKEKPNLTLLSSVTHTVYQVVEVKG